ncbi:glutamate synthase large subunit [Kiloniella laminariae]|uniref:glutamate synthase large subunit n=1 Tax=Kiloniella laminariae TaxID=454162 RepID=UPI00036B4F1E|nr:glutamate synthase large subunit [Kiloniella laminariae]
MEKNDPIARWEQLAAHYEKNGLYNPEDEHSSCGVGLVAAIDGTPRRSVVEAGIDALKAVWHRGAVDADGKTGDGCGIHVEIPQDFFREHIERIGHKAKQGQLAIGMVFLPRTDFASQERCRVIVEREILNFGYSIYGWRQVPVNTSICGEKAGLNRPEIEQIMIANSAGVDDERFETDLYIIRRRIEAAAERDSIKDFYICSLSCRSIIYKGMVLAENLSDFYPDLLDERFVSSFAIFHQRFSTNTFPTWHLAQPFRVIAHNGEINTLRGNVNWMKSHECRIDHPKFGSHVEDLKPVIRPGSSDSAALDAVFELMIRSDRSLPMAKTLLVPEAWSKNDAVPQHHKELYAYCNAVMEPWDGPAAICAFSGPWALAGTDRNGLRPLRYAITNDGLLFAGSETGMVHIDISRIIEKGRLGPGQMIAVNFKEGRLYKDHEIKDRLAGQQPFGDWLKNIMVIEDLVKIHKYSQKPLNREELRRRQLAFGLTIEDMELILHPMVELAKEAVGSMGDDTPLAVLSDNVRPMHHFFRQNFSQVTNPPIDSLREKQVMSLITRLGNLGNVLDEEEGQVTILQLDSPVLTNSEFVALSKHMGRSVGVVDCTFDANGKPGNLRNALRRIRREAEEFVREGFEHVILTDETQSSERIAIPMILATGAVHTHLVAQKLRSFCSINVRSAECLDVHYFAVLIGVGATTVNAYLAEEAIADRHRRGLFGDLSFDDCMKRYTIAVDEGLLKIMGKMGISVISSYRGGYNFEALGLSRTLVDEFFPGMPSRISGIGMSGLEEKALELHNKAWGGDSIALPVGGFYRYRAGQELHAWEGQLIHTMQTAVTNGSYSLFKKYTKGLQERPPINLRDLLDFKRDAKGGLDVEDTESITSIRKRFITPAMSLGALSPEAHGTLNIAMNRIGAKSDSGEGGEVPERYVPKANGDNENSAIKQVASGRFGVTAEYLNKCREIEIKVAQGAKPGEGGQLPGFKVTELIARLRHATPGVTLISPPPHHDIYSIEDLAQLIYDLKQINPDAKVCVKLVARSGIGTIAAGVAKAKADVILISGNVGGTGASPQTSVKFAGIPWEIGLSEVHQVLTLNGLRNKITLRTDGGLKTGRDIVIAALLGAEEYGVGTASLVAMGCIMVRQCHSNTCPVGVCTQDDDLRARFAGTPEKVVNLFSFIAEEVREILASLGFKTLNEIIGRTDLLKQVSRGAPHLDDLDLNPLLALADAGDSERYCTAVERNPVPDSLDAQIIEDAKPFFDVGEKMQLLYNVRNTHRAVGTRLASMITRRFGMKGLQPDHITVRMRGSAGQSLGAFAVQGMKLEVFGDANDYVGKGLSGGTIVVRPLASSKLQTQDNTIIGNTVLYGATAGKLLAAGQAGERFAVRNSGADVVVEGCGSNGCEYMTGGTAVILGDVGLNFGAGMSGGMAFVYDPNRLLPKRINSDTVIYQQIETEHWEGVLLDLMREHQQETGSVYTERLLNDWQRIKGDFWQVIPKEMLARLAHPASVETELKTA